ncbi:MAG: shikimate kinase [Pirellulales bacterium]|nr:shikimate kinase [Pirellulales bacterium]
MNSSILLIGYRGVGKTCVARELAVRLGSRWVDADDEVERRAGKSIAQMFAEEGEAAFRSLERDVVAQLCGVPGQVVALGGGAVLSPPNRAAIRTAGVVVWLQASVDSIVARLATDPTTTSRRPNLTTAGGRQEIESLLAQRAPFYQECATLIVDTENKSPAKVAEEILARL